MSVKEVPVKWMDRPCATEMGRRRAAEMDRQKSAKREASQISRQLVIEDTNTTVMSMCEYRKEVIKACHQYRERQLKSKMRNKEGDIMQKYQKINKDFYGRKPFFDKKVPSHVRSHFATRVGMLPVAGNFRHNRWFARIGWLCRSGQEREEERHITDYCPLYRDLRKQYGSLEDDDQLVDFFQQMLKRRDLLEEKEQNNWSRKVRVGADQGEKEQE